MAVLFPVFNSSFEGIQALHSSEQCYPMRKNFTISLTNEQVYLRCFVYDNAFIIWIFDLFEFRFALHFYFLIPRTLTQKLLVQISPGVWYFGLFNGIGATRTQSKMVNMEA